MGAGSAEALWIEGLRRMSPVEKLCRVADLNRTVVGLARERILSWHGPEISEREILLRLASLWLPADLMKRAFGWDPQKEGY